jgi:hypothetical protein
MENKNNKLSTERNQTTLESELKQAPKNNGVGLQRA